MHFDRICYTSLIGIKNQLYHQQSGIDLGLDVLKIGLGFESWLGDELCHICVVGILGGYYHPVIKHGVLENPPFRMIVPAINPHFARGFHS